MTEDLLDVLLDGVTEPRLKILSEDEARDMRYASTGWGRTTYPKVLGTPNATGDGIPDIWAVGTDGHQWLIQGGTNTVGNPTGRDATRTTGTPS
ncbi:hypothetical protein OG280_37460 [Streptomyces virginiae]|uniref:hypothetical protein n=1 Tax=Streptomyces virginiae TaxID=1961 RepID=UPI00324C06BB